MVTLAQCYAELRSRQSRLQEAESRGWRDCIPSERRCVSEFEHAFVEMLLSTGEGPSKLIELAGAVELGDLPLGISLSYSDEDTQ